MLVNLSSRSHSFFIPIVEFIKQSQLRMVVNYIVLGVLCAGTAYWVWSHFWQNRRVQKETDEDLFDLFESRIPHFSKDEKSSKFHYSEDVQPKRKYNFEESKEKKKESLEQDQFQSKSVEKVESLSLTPKLEKTELTQSVQEESFNFDLLDEDLTALEELDENEVGGEFNENEVDNYLKELISELDLKPAKHTSQSCPEFT